MKNVVSTSAPVTENPAVAALLTRYVRTANRVFVLEANNRPRAARRLRVRAGGLRAALRRMGVEA